MKVLILALVCFCGVIYAQDLPLFVEGKDVIPQRRGRAAKADAVACDTLKVSGFYCNGPASTGVAKENVCDSDAAVRCIYTPASANGVVPVVAESFVNEIADKLTCKANGGFCVEPSPGQASCSANRDPACAAGVAPVSKFVCTSDGVFPDPFDCKKYYFCKKDTPTQDKACPDLYVFDPSRPDGNYCRLTMNNYCTKAACGNTFNSIIMAFTWFPKSLGSYVAKCQGSEKSPARMYRCGAGFEPDTSGDVVKCNLVCAGASKGEDITDPTKYFECVFNGSTWVSQPNQCPPGEKYDNAVKKCVK